MLKVQIFEIKKVDFVTDQGEHLKFDKVTYGIRKGLGYSVQTTRSEKDLDPNKYITGKEEEYEFELTSSGKVQLIFK